MRVTVLITIVSTQLLDREEERMELSVRGRLSYHGGTTRLLYTETDDEGTATRVTITCTQGTAHHAAAADTEKVVDAVKGQHQRHAQRYCGILHGVIEITDKICISNVV